MYALCAVPLRPRSGVYFIPLEFRPHWHAVMRALPLQSLYAVECAFDTLSAHALAQAFEREIEPWLRVAEEELLHAHPRRRETLTQETAAIFAKLAKWPALSMPACEERLKKIVAELISPEQNNADSE